MSNWKELKENPRLRNAYDSRVKIIRLIREFFWRAGFVETDTPVAVRLASQEPYLNPVPVVFHDPDGRAEQFYLRTSPEYALKKLLAAGYEKVFEIGKVFRDYEEFGKTHNTEFTMIEWYRAPGNLGQLMDDTENLFKYIVQNIPSPTRGGTKGGVLAYKEKQININCAWDRLSMKEVWQKYIGVNLDDYLEIEKMRELAAARGYAVSADDAYEDLFFKIFLNEIEPGLGVERPIFVYDYPQQMTSLSRLCEHDPRYAERFELYVGGLELANAFGELTIADEQKRRLEEDKNKRAQAGKSTWDVDPDFIAAIADLPEAARRGMAGIALGVDRVVLLFTGAKDINEVIFQSVKDQLES